MRRFVWISLSLLVACAGREAPLPAADAGPVTQDITQMVVLLREAEADAAGALRSRRLGDLKAEVDRVYAAVWGLPSGIRQGGATAMHGWKTRWQARFTEFDPAYGARYGDEPAALEDAAMLGVVGLGRDIRRQLDDRNGTEDVVASLNNVIGWMRLDDGVTKAERQPRIDLTYLWDADQAFWLSDADTGWIFMVQAQALNILKTDYAGDLALARGHVRDLQRLIRQCLEGLDHDGDGRIGSGAMEGGLLSALQVARSAGI